MQLFFSSNERLNIGIYIVKKRKNGDEDYFQNLATFYLVKVVLTGNCSWFNLFGLTVRNGRSSDGQKFRFPNLALT